MVDFIAYAIVIAVTLALLTLMGLIVRATTTDTENSRFLQDLVEILFKERRRESDDEQAGQAPARAHEPFAEPCPACAEQVTEDDVYCPSCELRLLD